MNEHNKGNVSTEGLPQETDVIGMLKRMQQQLVYLEKKIDTLISQSQSPKPFRPQSYSYNQGHRPGHSQGHARPYDNRRPDGAQRGFVPKKKPFYGKRER